MNVQNGQLEEMVSENAAAIAAVGNKVDELQESMNRMVEVMNAYMQANNESLVAKMTELLSAQHSMMVHEQRRAISLFPRALAGAEQPQTQTATDNSERSPSEGEAEVLGKFHPALPLETVVDVATFNEKLLVEEFAKQFVSILTFIIRQFPFFYICPFHLQTEYYEEILVAPAAATSSDADNRVSRNKTLMYAVANRLIKRELFGLEITWSGHSPKGIRTKFRAFENIFKWTHGIIKRYDANVKLSEVEDFYRLCICKPGAKRTSRLKNARKSTGRRQFTRTKVVLDDGSGIAKEDTGIDDDEDGRGTDDLGDDDVSSKEDDKDIDLANVNGNEEDIDEVYPPPGDLIKKRKRSYKAMFNVRKIKTRRNSIKK